MFSWKIAVSYWLTRVQACRWMQSSVVTSRGPLDEEAGAEEDIQDN